jgi:hypothetical protein
MRTLPGVLFLLAALALAAMSSRADPVFPSSQIACVKSAQYNGGVVSKVLVIGNSTQQIYLCGFLFVGTVTGTENLGYATTGTACGSVIAITPAFPVGPTLGPVNDHRGSYYSGLTPVPVGIDLCLVVTTSTNAQAIVYYAQF